MKKTRPTFSPEFRLECTQLVLNQGYSVAKVAQAMNVGKSTMDCGDVTYIWVGNRWAYLAVVMDLFARKPIG